jgi:glycosyltransferase involved in cell wall biosynthesis
MSKWSGELKVALVGIYPPPYGGVSVHVQRLHARCLSNNIRCTVYDVSRRVKKAQNVVNVTRIWNWPRILASRQDVIHVHTTSMHWEIPAIFYYLARIKGSKYVLSYHSLRYSPQDFSPPGRWMMKVILSSAAHCIAVNPEIRDGLIALGARTDKISVIPAFLPPAANLHKIDEIPREVRDFMENHSPVISAGAFRMVFHDGQDRYGIDMCIEMCTRLKSIYPRVGVVFCLPEIGDRAYFARLQQEIKDKNVADSFLFVTKHPGEVYPIWQKSDIFVRPTNSDGDAVSLREALYLKTPSVASDAAPRPEGTVIFRNRDVEDFIARVKMVWDNYDDYREKTNSLKIESGLKEILQVYRGVADKDRVSQIY